jgi:hypothetical protein
MSAILPFPHAIDSDESAFEAATLESNIPVVKPAPAPVPGGWDPYEVWRTRIFAPQEAGSNKK